MASVGPLYSLRQVQDLAEAGKVDFSRNAARDYAELGYGPEKVTECLRWLSEDEFQKTITYGDISYDAYVTPHYGGPAKPKKIYVKLRISRDRLFVTSFHTERVFQDE